MVEKSIQAETPSNKNVAGHEPVSAGGEINLIPVDKEYGYPIRQDQYETIKDNIPQKRLTTVEGVLLSSGIAGILAALGAIASSIGLDQGIEFYWLVNMNGLQATIHFLFLAFGFGCGVAFAVNYYRRRNSSDAKAFERLDIKICAAFKHANKKDEH